MALALGVERAGKPVFSSLNDGRYQAQNTVLCNRFTDTGVDGSTLVANMAASVDREGRQDEHSILFAKFNEW